jgi:hypothetical protein
LDKGHALLLEFPDEFSTLDAAARTPSREVLFYIEEAPLFWGICFGSM